jgi:hypothetical protein
MEAFQEIEDEIVLTPLLVTPNYSHDFKIFSFASKDKIVGIPLQRTGENLEQPIAFISIGFREVEIDPYFSASLEAF